MLILADTVSLKQDEENFMLFDNLNGGIYKLNELSYQILSLCDGKNTDEDILINITKGFDVTMQEAKKDFEGLVRILLDKKYIYDNDNEKGAELYEKDL